MRGVKRLNDKPARARLPITLELLVQLLQAWFTELEEGDARMLWAAATMYFFRFL